MMIAGEAIRGIVVLVLSIRNTLRFLRPQELARQQSRNTIA